mgnify:CR=1 FL=1
MNVVLVSEDELRRVVSMDREGLEAVRLGFAKLSSGEVVQPPIMHIEIAEHNGEVDLKGAYVKGLGSFALKLSSGFFENHKRGLPSASGLMVLVSAETGVPQALLLDNGYLTDVRTGLAGALAAELLAPEAVSTVGILGSGAQARYQLRALTLVRDFERVLVWSRSKANAERYAQEMSAELGRPVSVAGAEEVVSLSQVVVTTTPALQPVLLREWVHSGQHITAMGSDSAGKNELDPAVLGDADVVVCDHRGQCLQFGELRSAVASGAVPANRRVAELGEVILGERAGRTSADQVTVADLTGTGVQDTMIARLALERVRAAADATS